MSLGGHFRFSVISSVESSREKRMSLWDKLRLVRQSKVPPSFLITMAMDSMFADLNGQMDL